MKTKNKKRKVIIVIVIFLVLAMGIVTFIVRGKRKMEQNGMNNNKGRQNFISLEKMDLTTSISATGTVESKKTKTVSADINGVEVEKVKVSVGDTVKKGDVLVTFDERDLKEVLEEALENQRDAKEEAADGIENANEQISDAKETYSDEKKELKKKVSEAKGKWKKAKKEQKSATTPEEKAKAKEEMAQAKTEYENAITNQKNTNKQNKEKISDAEKVLEEARSNGEKTVKEAKKQVEEANDTLEKCYITAPISGVVTSVGVEEGENYGGGTMFQIDDNSSYAVSTTVDEYDISKVKVGQKVILLTEATEEDELKGEITFVAPSTSSSTISPSQDGQSATATSSSSSGYEVKIRINTQDERLKMGMTAKCSIIMQEVADVYAVPYDAIQENRDGSAVIYVTEGEGESVSFREIQVTKGMESDYYVEIQGADLSDGMKVQIPTDEITDESSDTKEKSGFPMPGNMGGDMSQGGGDMRGNMPQRGSVPGAPRKQ